MRKTKKASVKQTLNFMVSAISNIYQSCKKIISGMSFLRVFVYLWENIWFLSVRKVENI